MGRKIKKKLISKAEIHKVYGYSDEHLSHTLHVSNDKSVEYGYQLEVSGLEEGQRLFPQSI